ncbi:hypothetical protein [Paenibacillus odorifer]|uniref:hypothetical protein n=1 Tax=Paenibacillus odorifer TaxID=189426 RepID=UPI0015C3F607|nr:hypothetical protein [Paenibacillus odorifer]
MKINIDEKARKLFGSLCPTSTSKCETLMELDYKIQRCIDLGRRLNVSINKKGGKNL